MKTALKLRRPFPGLSMLLSWLLLAGLLPFAVEAASTFLRRERNEQPAESPGGDFDTGMPPDEMPAGGAGAFPEDVLGEVPGYNTLKAKYQAEKEAARKKANGPEPYIGYNYGDDFVANGTVSKTADVERRIAAGYPFIVPSDMKCLESDSVDLYVVCGPPMVSKCQCEAMGCCWGEDNPYYDLLVRDRYNEVPTCHRMRGEAPKMSDMKWSVMARSPSDIMINGLLNGADSRFMMVSAAGTCQGSASIDGTEVLPISSSDNQVELQVTITDPGEYFLCMGSISGTKSGEVKGTFSTNFGTITAFDGESLIPGCEGAPKAMAKRPGATYGDDPDPDKEGGKEPPKEGKKVHL